jgi:hypothetical protein
MVASGAGAASRVDYRHRCGQERAVTGGQRGSEDEGVGLERREAFRLGVAGLSGAAAQSFAPPAGVRHQPGGGHAARRSFGESARVQLPGGRCCSPRLTWAARAPRGSPCCSTTSGVRATGTTGIVDAVVSSAAMPGSFGPTNGAPTAHLSITPRRSARSPWQCTPGFGSRTSWGRGS